MILHKHLLQNMQVQVVYIIVVYTLLDFCFKQDLEVLPACWSDLIHQMFLKTTSGDFPCTVSGPAYIVSHDIIIMFVLTTIAITSQELPVQSTVCVWILMRPAWPCWNPYWLYFKSQCMGNLTGHLCIGIMHFHQVARIYSAPVSGSDPTLNYKVHVVPLVHPLRCIV